MQMHNGTRIGEGSFNVGLKVLFYNADNSNRHKLVKAFPEFFGDSVPEFNIYPKKLKIVSQTPELFKRANKLIKQIEMSDYSEPDGHHLINNKALHDLKQLIEQFS